MADVFISYSRTDSELVHALDDHLKGEGRDVWVDWEDIAPADDWQQDIYDNIDAAESFVFVVSAKSLDSRYCGKELTRAQEGGKRIIPIACDAADPAEAPESLAQLNWIWCRDGDDRGVAFEKLSSALETDLSWAKAHTRLLVRAVEWDARKDGSLLLRGADLREAEQNLASNTGKQPEPTELQQRYVLASRRAATRRQRIMLGSAAVALVVSIGLGVAALLQRNDARAATQAAGASAAAATAGNPETSLDLSLLLSYAAYQARPGVQGESSVVSALESARTAGLSMILHGHAGIVLGVAYNPDGSLLASASDDGTVRLWDLRRHRPLGVLRGQGGPVNALAFSPDGRTVASGDADGTVRLWAVRSLASVAVLRVHPLRGPVNALAFSPSGRILAAGYTDNTNGSVQLWNWRTKRPRGRPMSNQDGTVHGVAFAPGGTILAAATDDGVELWNLRTDRLAAGPFGTEDTSLYINGVAFSHNGTLASAGTDGTVRLWRLHEIPQGKLEITRKTKLKTQGGNVVLAVAFDPGGRLLAYGNADGTVRIWDLRGHRFRGVRRGYPGDVYAIAFAPDGRTIASGGAEHAIRIWRVRPPRLLHQGGQVTSLAFDPHGQAFASGSSNGTVKLWNARTGRPSESLGGQAGAVASVAFGPQEEPLLAIGAKKGIRLWDERERRWKGNLFDTGDGKLLALAFTPDGKRLASAGNDGKVRLWGVEKVQPRPLRRIPVPIHYDSQGSYSLAFSPNGSLLALSGDGDSVLLWSARKQRFVGQLRGHTDFIEGLAFSRDGRLLAAASDDGTVRIWDVATRKEIGAPLQGHSGTVNGVAISPDGETLASAGWDATLRLWDVGTGRQIGTPLFPDGSALVNSVNAVAFSPTGHALVVANQTGTVRIYRGIFWRDDADLRGKICNLVVGSLTSAEVQANAPGLPYKPACPG